MENMDNNYEPVVKELDVLKNQRRILQEDIEDAYGVEVQNRARTCSASFADFAALYMAVAIW